MFELSEWSRLAGELFASPWVQSGLILIGVILATMGVKYVSSRKLKGVIEDSENLYDDKAQQHLEVPVVVSLFIAGLYVAASLLTVPDIVEFVATGLLVTLLVVLWVWRLARLIEDFFSLGREDLDWLDDTIRGTSTSSSNTAVNSSGWGRARRMSMT